MSTRRNVRLRKEYLYRKSLEGKERAAYERKQQVKEAIREGKAIPTELRNEERSLRRQIELDDDATETPKTHIDDEYANAGAVDPKICVTTSREPSSRLKQFAKEIRLIFPNSQRINRGNQKVEELVDACRRHGFTDMVVVQETRGEPDGLIISHLPYGPTAYFSLSGCVLRHDIDSKATISEQLPHIILHGLNTQLGQRLGNMFRFMFPPPKPDAKRVITFANDADRISFRHHVYTREGKQVDLQECGPRFEMQLYQLRLGTLEQGEAENEWVLRPYMNTAKKRRFL